MAAPRLTTYELIHHLARGNVPQAEVTQVLNTILNAQESRDLIMRLQEQDLRLLVDRIDQVYQS
jgi:hypothetical protein